MLVKLKLLFEAELRYAYFNARRTAFGTTNDAISVSYGKSFGHIEDLSRSQSEYYNRVVVHPDAASVAEILKQIPLTSLAIELVIPQQTNQNFTCLLNAGFRPSNSLCYLVAHPSSTTSMGMDVRELQSDQRDFFFDLLELSGASFPPEKRRATSHFYCSDEFRCFVAFDSTNRPIGWATMYVCNEMAFLANAYTLPSHRAKGAHTALLNARLDLASRLQLPYAFTDVEPASQSHRNCDRRGFRLLSVNTIWTRNR